MIDRDTNWDAYSTRYNMGCFNLAMVLSNLCRLLR